MIIDLIKYVITNIIHRFTRSFLTILSILIGIMAIFALISFGQGLSKFVNDFSSEMGADKIVAQPKGSGPPGSTGTFFTKDDIEFMKKINGVSEATGSIMNQGEVKRKESDKGKWVWIMGMPADTSEMKLMDESFGGIEIFEGRPLKKGDGKKITMGYSYSVPDKMFPGEILIGDKILLNGQKYEVIGFYEEIGTPDDTNIYMMNDEVEGFFDIKDQYSFVYIRSAKGEDPKIVAEKLEEKLRKKKDQKKGQEDFFIQTFEELIATFNSVLGVLNAILVIIAGISIVVAAVNIMNTMYTAVLERTKEIGVMKAIGAKNNYILFVFFMEAGLLGLIGGIFGIILGWGVSTIGGNIAATAGYGMLTPYFPLWLIVSCLMGAFFVGALSGLFPAIQASKQKPVDALRYE